MLSFGRRAPVPSAAVRNDGTDGQPGFWAGLNAVATA
jgi:hypothetical protein